MTTHQGEVFFDHMRWFDKNLANPKQKLGSLISLPVYLPNKIRSLRKPVLQDNAMPDIATGTTLNGSVGNGERLRAWLCFRENLLGGGRKIVHVAEKCHRLPNLLHS